MSKNNTNDFVFDFSQLDIDENIKLVSTKEKKEVSENTQKKENYESNDLQNIQINLKRNDFLMKEDFETKVEQNSLPEEPYVKKEFGENNKAVLEIEEDDENIEKEMLLKDALSSMDTGTIIHPSNVSKLVSEELNLENTIEKSKEKIKETKNSKNIIKVLYVGNNENYYKTKLEPANDFYQDIKFVACAYTGGKNTFYMIDALKPDVVMIRHDTPVQNALQFFKTLKEGLDENKNPYIEKYKDLRVVVVAPNDIDYELKMRSEGVKYSIKEINSRTQEIILENLAEILREAKKDIILEKQKRIREEELRKEKALATATKPADYMDKDSVNIEEEIRNIKEIKEIDTQEEQQILGVYQKDNNRNNSKKIISVYSSTGGAGRTTFASNLAVILQKYSNLLNPNSYKVALLEYNLEAKCMDLFFNIKSDKNLASLLKEFSTIVNTDIINNNINDNNPLYDEMKKAEQDIDDELKKLISRYMYQEEDTNLDIMFGLSFPMELHYLKKGYTTKLLKNLKELYDVVIVDLSTDISKVPILEALENSDEIYYIMPMDVVSIRNVTIFNQFFTGNMFNISPEKIKIIINKAADNEDFNVQQVYKALTQKNCTPWAVIPNQESVISSCINRGIPIALENPQNEVSKAIYEIALNINPSLSESFLNEDTQSNKQQGFFSKLFSKKPKKAQTKEKKSKKSLFGKKNKSTESEKSIVPIEENKQKKESFFGSLFKRKQKNQKEEVYEEIKVKKKKGKGIGSLFGKKNPKQLEQYEDTPISNIESSRKETSPVVLQNNQQNSSRLEPLIIRQPRKK